MQQFTHVNESLSTADSRESVPLHMFVLCWLDFLVFFCVDVAGEPLSFLLALLSSLTDRTSPFFVPTIWLCVWTLFSIRLMRTSTGIQNGFFIDRVRSEPHPRSEVQEETVLFFSRSEFLATRVAVVSLLSSLVATVFGFWLLRSGQQYQLITAVTCANIFVAFEIVIRGILIASKKLNWFALVVLQSVSSGEKTTIDLLPDGSLNVRKLPYTCTIMFTPEKNRRRRRV